MKTRTITTRIGLHSILENGITLVDLKYAPKTQTSGEYWLFSVFHSGHKVGSGDLEVGEFSWDQGERMPDGVKELVEEMIATELPNEFETEDEEPEFEPMSREDRASLLRRIGPTALLVSTYRED